MVTRKRRGEQEEVDVDSYRGLTTGKVPCCLWDGRVDVEKKDANLFLVAANAAGRPENLNLLVVRYSVGAVACIVVLKIGHLSHLLRSHAPGNKFIIGAFKFPETVWQWDASLSKGVHDGTSGPVLIKCDESLWRLWCNQDQGKVASMRAKGFASCEQELEPGIVSKRSFRIPLLNSSKSWISGYYWLGNPEKGSIGPGKFSPLNICVKEEEEERLQAMSSTWEETSDTNDSKRTQYISRIRVYACRNFFRR